LERIYYLILKDFKTEYREKYAISGLLLYVVVLVFTVFISFIEMEARTWVTLLWLLILFFSINGAMHSSARESSVRHLYYYALADPIDVLGSKVLYNLIIIAVMTVLCYLGMSTISPSPVIKYKVFLPALILGLLGIACTLTLTSQLANVSGRSATLMAILSFPVLLPVLLQSIRLSMFSTIDGIGDFPSGELALLAGVDMLIIALSLWLFPYLWRK
jgi:heme exporter protein B